MTGEEIPQSRNNDSSDTIEVQSGVAVIIAAKDAEDTIARAVSSALLQPEACQVIVVDDGSSDETAEVARQQDDGKDRLTVISLEKNLGPSGARNRALEVVTTEWFTILDADDFMDEGRLGRLLELAGDTYDLVADDLWLVTEGQEDGPRDQMWSYDGPDLRRALTLELFVLENIPLPHRRRRELGFLKPLIRVSRLRQLGHAYDETMRLGEDYDLYCRLLGVRTPALLTGPQGYVAVRSTSSLSGSHGVRDLAAFYACTRSHQKFAKLSALERRALAKLRNSTARRYRWVALIEAGKTRNLGGIIRALCTSPDVMLLLAQKSFDLISDRLKNPSEA